VKDVLIDSVKIFCDTTTYNLKSYAPSSYLGANNSIYAYNHKTHAIDVIDLNANRMTGSIQLAGQGPDNVNLQVSGLQAWTADSIVLYDSQALCVINGNGVIIDKIMLPEDYFCRIETNARASIAGFDINFDNGIVRYPIYHRESKESEVLVYDFAADSILQRVALKNPANDGKHGFMQAPHVTYTKDLIIYNYPFESEIHVYDMATDSIRTINPHSNFVDDAMPASNANSFEEAAWYALENFFHSPVYHIEKAHQYVRLTLGSTPLNRNDDIEEAMYSRPMYLMFFDEKFNPIGESKLPSNRYNPYAGWLATSESMAFFVDNLLLTSTDDELLIDYVKLKR